MDLNLFSNIKYQLQTFARTGLGHDFAGAYNNIYTLIGTMLTECGSELKNHSCHGIDIALSELKPRLVYENVPIHYSDVIIGAMASQITSLAIV